jgi:hypothetical protein
MANNVVGVPGFRFMGEMVALCVPILKQFISSLKRAQTEKNQRKPPEAESQSNSDQSEKRQILLSAQGENHFQNQQSEGRSIPRNSSVPKQQRTLGQ